MKKTAIIGAMAIETEQLIAALEQSTQHTCASVTITEGTISGRPVAVCRCAPGKVNAALCAQTILLSYQPDQVLSIGVAGALFPMQIGQAAVADCFVQYDIDTTPLGDPPGLIPGLNTVQLFCDRTITGDLEAACGACDIPVSRAIFATGDQFATADTIQKVSRLFEASVFEMEGGAIAQVCARAGVPFGAIRVISDNGDAKVDYETFKFEAAAKSIRLICAYLNRL